MTNPLPPVPRDDVSANVKMSPQWLSWFSQLYTYVTAPSIGGGGILSGNSRIDTAAPLTGGDKISASPTISIIPGGITNNLLSLMAPKTIKGNISALAGQPADLSAAQIKSILAITFSDVAGNLPESKTPALNGAVTSTAGSLTTTLASAPPSTLKGNVTAAAAPPTDLTVAQVLALMGFVRAFKAAGLALSSNTTLLNDTDLVVPVLVGTYNLNIFLNFWEETASDGGFQFDLNAGTAVSSTAVWAVSGYTNAAYASAAAVLFSSAQQYANISISQTAPSWVSITGQATFTSAGTFGVRCAQNTSSVNVTHLARNSFMTLEKVA